MSAAFRSTTFGRLRQGLLDCQGEMRRVAQRACRNGHRYVVGLRRLACRAATARSTRRGHDACCNQQEAQPPIRMLAGFAPLTRKGQQQ